MASSGKKKTTMAKLNRESRLRERRVEKQLKKDARKRAALAGTDDSQASPSPSSDGDTVATPGL
jgi:hypothetical protein